MDKKKPTGARQQVAADLLKLTKPSCRIGISWDNLSGNNVDLDLQGVIVDDKGHIVDAVYHNNLTALNGAVAHSGDDEDGAQEGFDEFIQVKLSKLPAQCKLIVFIVAACNGSLKDADNGLVGVEEGAHNTVKEVKIERSEADCDVVAYLIHRDGWYLQVVETPALFGSHFLDILEPNIGDIIRHEIPGAPKVQRVAFMMEKGAVTDFPQSKDLRRLLIGVGGALKKDAKAGVDIDVSAVLYHTDGRKLGVVDGKSRSKVKGVTHSGDGMAGGRSGDDEALSIDLDLIDAKIARAYIVLSIKDGTFELVQSAYARVTDQAMVELAAFDIDCGNHASHLIVATLLRQEKGRWGCTAVGHFCNNYKECTDALDNLTKGLPLDGNGAKDDECLSVDSLTAAKSTRKQKFSRTSCQTVIHKTDSIGSHSPSREASVLQSRYSMTSQRSTLRPATSANNSRASISLMPSCSEIGSHGGTRGESVFQSSDSQEPQKPVPVNWDATQDVRFVDDDQTAEDGKTRRCAPACCRSGVSGVLC
mmetsp:Transcript_62187/g.115420  ORF Transcript_62187/g.115420 Transcript_62187/m.115420 type:complete len:533 (+) Transcript_62187:89-1687(+)